MNTTHYRYLIKYVDLYYNKYRYSIVSYCYYYCPAHGFQLVIPDCTCWRVTDSDVKIRPVAPPRVTGLHLPVKVIVYLYIYIYISLSMCVWNLSI